MQTTKPRARWIAGPGAAMWEVTHPGTRVSVWALRPRDGGAVLLERYVLPNQTEKRGEGAA
ncbi:hypothetical protein [Burkholderia ubonensis]|uniref:hypothetical protein n=1 Tax=Burkholderia ubonensis TaxID=101571 RepID=UPI000AEF6A4B|nr:hypothetical protein [Burkholderia ubonensis]